MHLKVWRCCITTLVQSFTLKFIIDCIRLLSRWLPKQRAVRGREQGQGAYGPRLGWLRTDLLGVGQSAPRVFSWYEISLTCDDMHWCQSRDVNLEVLLEQSHGTSGWLIWIRGKTLTLQLIPSCATCGHIENSVYKSRVVSWAFDLWLLMHFAEMNTRTCESQQKTPIDFGSPKMLANLKSRAVPPDMPWSPQGGTELGGDWWPASWWVSTSSKNGNEICKALHLCSAQQTTPSKVSCQQWIVSSFICELGLKEKKKKKETPPKKHNKKKYTPVLMNENLSKLLKLSQLFWEEHITQITEEILWEILWVISIS